MLTDQGARVIKVEPLAGDPIRFNMPIPEWASARVTQGKESLAVDVFTEEGKAIVEELIRRADLVLHSYRGGVAARMGLDAEAALALNPDLIYHHGQGYGVTGPYSRRQAYAPTIAAGSGFSRRSGGGAGEALLLRALPEGRFEALVFPGPRLKPGKRAAVVDPATGHALAELRVETVLEDGLRQVRVLGPCGDLDWDAVDRIGRMPLPHYIAHPAGAEDERCYQTVYHAREGEAVAAPTAGLHFTEELIGELRARDCLWCPVRLHVGLGTFRPMQAEDIDDHIMHE